MSITNYTELVSAVTSWSNRTDTVTLARIPDFIMLTERVMDTLKLQVREQLVANVGYLDATTNYVPSSALAFTEVMQAQITGTFDGTAAIPGTVTATTVYPPMERLSSILQRSQLQTLVAAPQYFSDRPDNSGWEFWPFGGKYQVTVWTWGKAGPLTAANPTTPVLTYYPHIYLSGVMAQVDRFLKVPPGQSIWGADFSAAIDAANQATRAAMYSGSTLRMKSPR